MMNVEETHIQTPDKKVQDPGVLTYVWGLLACFWFSGFGLVWFLLIGEFDHLLGEIRLTDLDS